MTSFVAKSDISIKLLDVAKMACLLDVNVLITGKKCSGKRLLAKEIAPSAVTYEAMHLEKLMQTSKLNIQTHKTIIICNIQDITNIEDMTQKLKGIKIIATSSVLPYNHKNTFDIHIDIPPLCKRKDDALVICEQYINNANDLFGTKHTYKELKNDNIIQSDNIKREIYKQICLDTMSTDDILDKVEDFVTSNIEDEKSYKDILNALEKKVLQSSFAKYGSQLGVSKHLNINRMTLRKKLVDLDINL